MRRVLAGVVGVAATGLLSYAAGRYALNDPTLRPTLKDTYHTVRDRVPGLTETDASAAQAQSYPLERAEEPLLIYTDGLETGWADWSWASRKIQDAAKARSGKYALSMQAADYKGVYLSHAPLAIGGYGALEFWVWLPSGAEKTVGICVAREDKKLAHALPLEKYVADRTATPQQGESGWRKISVPLTDFGLKKESGVITGVGFQALKSGDGPTVYFDDIRLTTDETLPLAILAATVPVTIDAQADQKAISPLIYGTALASREEAKQYGIALNRWGGNPNTRYNWVAESWNAARDWEFRNYGWKDGIDPKRGAGATADNFVEKNQTAGAATLFTIPTIGWVSKDGVNAHRSLAVPKRGDMPLGDIAGPIAGYDPAENRARTSVRSLPRKGRPFEMQPVAAADGKYTVYQDEFVAHLVKRFGTAKNGGVRFYAMDNEPDLWAHTHTDVQPALPGYDDLLARFYEYASAVKDVDASAEVTGPVSWGWTGYNLSPQDTTKERLFSKPDRKAHGDEPFLLWFLKAVRKKDEAAGRRTLDVLDIHFYPQQSGVYSDRADAPTRKLRLRSTRALWDASYRDESWISDSVELIPRMTRWIAEGYPGTNLGITEWNFGAENDISGGLATADALGIFGREGLYLANFWTKPKPDSFAAAAFMLYRNPEKRETAGGGFGDKSCRAVSPYPDRLSAYAATDSKSGALTIVLINKMPKATLTTPLTLTQENGRDATLRLYAFSEASPKITASAGPMLHGGKTTLTLPPHSATLVRIER